MSVLFGHPTGNPNAHHAALAHFEAGRLEAFCVPWMPTPLELRALRAIPPLRSETARLERRCFRPLLGAPRIEGRLGEWGRMARRLAGARWSGEQLSYEANDWLMRTMARACRHPKVTAVHAYEDCALWSFEAARRLGKICIYDLPIGYYPAWKQTEAELAAKFADWLPKGGLEWNRFVRPEQKRQEMALADLVLAPSSFVQRTIQQFTDKQVALAPYGVDLDFWQPPPVAAGARSGVRFIYAGACSLRKGTPVLFEAWRAAALPDAELELVGSWQFAEAKLHELPPGVRFTGPLSAEELRGRYQAADVFVFPSLFEGFGLVILEALACGLPVIATDATAGPDVLSGETGRVLKAGDQEALTEALRWFAVNAECLPAMKLAARAQAETYTWERYRGCVSVAVAPLV